MIKQNFKKYTICFFSCFLLLIMLYVSLNYNDTFKTIVENMQNNIIAAKTDQSSTSTTKASTGDMVDLLARLINGEARGEPYEGQVAVGAVVLNRVKSSEFPNTISGVIYQKNQFSCITDGQFNKAIDKNSTKNCITLSCKANDNIIKKNPKKNKDIHFLFAT